MSERPAYVYVFDINRRVYNRDEHGRAHGGPIFREHWRKETIVDETSKSYITELGTKVPKKNANKNIFLFSETEVDKTSWVKDNRAEIASKVGRLTDHDILVAIANLMS